MDETANLLLQYIIVGLILLGISIFVIIKLFRIKKKGIPSKCCGCSMSDACNAKLKENCKTPPPHEDNKDME